MVSLPASMQNEVPLCNSLTLRFSVSVRRSDLKFKKTDGYYNYARFYLHSTELKKSVGKPWHKEYPPSKKSIRANTKPDVKYPTPAIINQAIKNLLRLNAGLSLVQTKELKRGTKEVHLDDNELFVFWLNRYNEIAILDTSSRTDEERQAEFALICQHAGAFRLDSFCSAQEQELVEACNQLIKQVRASAKGPGNANAESNGPTSTLKLRTQMVRYAISLYLSEHDINPSHVMDLLIKASTPPKGTRAKISDNMRTRSLSIEQCREIYRILTSDAATPVHTGLLLMVFLGLDASEVSGLNCGDVSPITGYSGRYNLQIIREYRKVDKKYSLVRFNNINKYRFVPIPSQIYARLPKDRSTGEPDAPLLTIRNKRISPDVFTRELGKLSKGDANSLVLESNGRTRSIDLSFQPSSYKLNCRYYWKYHCGMQSGEINYLAGLSPDDTVSAHYIDYNNATMQLRMLSQMEYGMAMMNVSELNPWYKLDSRFVRKQLNVPAGLNWKAGVKLRFSKPAELALSTERGMTVICGGFVKNDKGS